MSKYVVFENNGELDVRAIRTFGISVKENENPIGFFGTGLKYSIAILAREGLGLSVISGEQRFVFENKKVSVRGKEFEIITMNGEELPFTTHLGANWVLWQAFREIYCNCLDEGGSVYLSDSMPSPQLEKTFVVVEGREFEDLYYKRGTIVLDMPQSSIKANVNGVTIYKQASGDIFYRGIRVFDLPKPALYTYNITATMTLTEDRTLKYFSNAVNAITLGVASCDDAHLIKEILTTKDLFFEQDLNFSILRYHEVASTVFMEALGKLYTQNDDNLNESAREFYREKMQKKTSKNFENAEPTEVEKKQLERAISICTKVFPGFSDYEVAIVKTLGKETMALADRSDSKIVLSKSSFKMGTNFLVSTLIEEYMHLESGHGDLTRGFQTYIFDAMTKLIEEHVLKEPL